MRSLTSGISGSALLSVGVHVLAFGSVLVVLDGWKNNSPISEAAPRISLGLKASQAGQVSSQAQMPVAEMVAETRPDPKPEPRPHPKPEPVFKKEIAPLPQPVDPVPEPLAEAEPEIQPEPKPAEQVVEPTPFVSASELSGHQGKTGELTIPVDQVETGDANEEGAEALEAAYDLLVIRKLKAQKSYPALAKRRKQEGDVRLIFCIDRAGKLIPGEQIEITSEWSVLEKAVHDQLKRAAPFPPPPEEVRWEKRTFTVNISFSLEDG